MVLMDIHSNACLISKKAACSYLSTAVWLLTHPVDPNFMHNFHYS